MSDGNAAPCLVPLSAVKDLVIDLSAAQQKAWDDRVARAHERIYGFKSIAAAIREMRPGTTVDEKTVRRWWKARRFPVDKDPIGYSVTRWELERWMRARAA